MQVALPEYALPAKLVLNPERGLSDDEFYNFCVENPGLCIERTELGEIVIVPPAGFESSFRSLEVSAELRQWAKRDGRGKAFDSSAMFLLPGGSARSPDAAWVSNRQTSLLTKAQRKRFVPLCPEFVVEVMSPSDRLSAAQAKMEEWMANGCQLAWLIDGESRSVYIYRPGVVAEQRTSVTALAGDGPVEGFQLKLSLIWEGL